MPQRPERFYWVYAEGMSGDLAARLTDAHRQLARDWAMSNKAEADCTWSNEEDKTPHKLWLFRTRRGVQHNATYTQFLKQLKRHIDELNASSKYGLRIRPTLPQPLVCGRDSFGNYGVDVGLHAVNDEYNGMLVTFSYWQVGGRRHPLHFQPHNLRRLTDWVDAAWGEVACHCHGGACHTCQGRGCFSCFRLDCQDCSGTGWKDFARWSNGGYRVNYVSGYPMAIFSP